MCRVISCVVGRRCFLWPVHFLGKTLQAFALLHFVLQLPVTPGISWLPTFAFQPPIMKRAFLKGVLVLEVPVGLHRIIQLQLLQHFWLGIDLDYCDIKWFAMETNRNHSVIFETAPKYCILDSFVDNDSYSIYSKGFIPTVIDIIVIWIKFKHSSPFSLTDS